MFTKITETDLANKGVTGLPDTPNLSTMEMQAKFDELAKDVVVPKFNNLVDELDEKDLDNVTHSEDITDFKLDADGRMQVSTDGGATYGYAGSTGHQIMDGSGTRYPARANLQFSQNVSITDYDEENGNKTFLSVVGEKGERGDGATIRVGTVESANTPSIENVGSLTDAIFNFKLPKGDSGDSATIAVGSVTKGENPSVYNSGTSSNAVFNFVLPKGDKGDTGQGINILGEYETLAELQLAHPTGQRGDAYMVGTDNPKDLYAWDIDHNQWINQGALQGAKGDTGNSATVTIGSVSEGQTMAVENVGTSTDAILNFTLKKGDKGDQGDTGTISVGTVTGGETASVTNVGTPTNAIFNFVIPKGEKGDQGSPTVINGKSGANVTLYGTDIYTSNQDGAYTVSQEISNLHTEIAENGGGSVIRVTFDEDQSGDTITFAIDGMNTITKVVPSVEPRMIEISTKEMGVMTITDTTISKSITLTIDTYELYTVPFLSGFDYQEWLTLGNVSGTYASLAEVLADEKALRQLFTKHASVDYLVECCTDSLDDDVSTIVSTDLCAKWINLRDYALDKLYENQYIKVAMDTFDKYFYGELVEVDGEYVPKGNVPIMTSNSAPYGVASASSVWSTFDAWRAFNGTNTDTYDCWATANTSGTIQYGFINPVCVKRLSIRNRITEDVGTPIHFSLEGSNDNSSWSQIKSFITTDFTHNALSTFYADENTNYYMYYRLNMADSHASSGLNIAQLQFYGRELKVSVPKMTANDAPWGEILKSTESGANYAWKAFDDSLTTHWEASSKDNQYVGYTFTSPIKVVKYLIGMDSTSATQYMAGKIKLQGYRDGAWEDISEQIINNYMVAGGIYAFDANSDYSYESVRAYCNEGSGTYGTMGCSIGELKIFGLDYSEHEERHWIYDHGVEVEEVDSYIINTGSLTKQYDSILITAGTSNSSGVFAQINKDISDYDLMRAKIGSQYTADGFHLIIDESPTRDWNGANWEAWRKMSYPLTSFEDGYLDISEFQSTHYICIGYGGVANSKVEVTEWWLE